MASKELFAQVEQIIWRDRARVIPSRSTDLANEILSTILAALQEPKERMNVAGCQADDPLGALIDWQGENCTPREGVANVWQAMLNASPLGEQSE